MEANAAARALENLNVSSRSGGRSQGNMQRNASGELRRQHHQTTRNGPSNNSNFDNNAVADQSGGGIFDNSYGQWVRPILLKLMQR